MRAALIHVLLMWFVNTITNLCPVSEAPVAASPPKKYQSYNSNYKTDEEKKEEVCSHNYYYRRVSSL